MVDRDRSALADIAIYTDMKKAAED